MKSAELEQLLREKGYDDNIFSLSLKRLPSEGYVLEKAGDRRWVVYYVERGYSRDVASFELESEACEYVLKKMLLEYGDIRFPPSKDH